MNPEAAASALEDPGERLLAYEMAVGVCDADGRQSDMGVHGRRAHGVELDQGHIKEVRAPGL